MSSDFGWDETPSKTEHVFERPEDTEDVAVYAELPTGTRYKVLNMEEKNELEKNASEYVTQNHLVNVADFQDLERLVTLELMCKRYSQWIIQEHDYDGGHVDIKELQRVVREFSAEIRGTKKGLGLDKAARDKDKGTSLADYIQTLGLRAKSFGIKRNTEMVQAITLWKELESLVIFHDNADVDERREFEKTETDIVDWVRSKIPEFNALDEAYREQQTLWIRD